LMVLGPGGSRRRLDDLLCNIALAGNRVHDYQGPGFFDDARSRSRHEMAYFEPILCRWHRPVRTLRRWSVSE
jgi:hypothetical protein